MNTLTPIGANESIAIAGHYFDVPAKVDTGADSSSVWASNIQVTPAGDLTFTLFGPQSPFYDGHLFTAPKGTYSAITGKSSTGHRYVRYRVQLPLKIAGRTIRAHVTLSDRSRHSMPVLIGRKTLAGKFLVDVKRGKNLRPRPKKPRSTALTSELHADPHAFHQKYHTSTKPNQETNL